MDDALVIPGDIAFPEYRDMSALVNEITETKMPFTAYVPGAGPKPYAALNRAADNISQINNAYVTYKGVVWPPPYGVGPAADFGSFTVFQNEKFIKRFDSYKTAVNCAQIWPDGVVAGEMIVAANYKPLPEYRLCTLHNFTEFYTLPEAVIYAKERAAEGKRCAVLAIGAEYDPTRIIWENSAANGAALITDAPFVGQMPELPRGCEVAALTMMINYRGLMVDKMTLAGDLKKSPRTYDDPNNGFIGDMYSMSGHGLGVYHAPVAKLARDYMPREIIDATGCAFTDLFYYLDRGRPVWVMTNTRFSRISENDFVYWDTPGGTVKVTYRMHAVLVTGYDDGYIYFHDPLAGADKKEPRDNFIGGWEQMGRQAVTTIN